MRLKIGAEQHGPAKASLFDNGRQATGDRTTPAAARKSPSDGFFHEEILSGTLSKNLLPGPSGRGVRREREHVRSLDSAHRVPLRDTAAGTIYLALAPHCAGPAVPSKPEVPSKPGPSGLEVRQQGTGTSTNGTSTNGTSTDPGRVPAGILPTERLPMGRPGRRWGLGRSA